MIVAFLLGIILLPIGWFVGIVMSIVSMDFSFAMSCAVSLDQLGNVVCGPLFNIVLIKKAGYKFGNPDETISSVLGKNHVTSTLTMVGRLLDRILNTIDKDHTIDSIDTKI